MSATLPDHGSRIAATPEALAIEAFDQEGDYYLLRYDRDGECVTDTWNQTVAAVKKQAAFVRSYQCRLA